MREILFRAKQKNNGEWVEGYYVKGATRHCIVKSLAGSPCYDVLPETIGQYTGLTDGNGSKIFEGDIIKAKDDIYGSPFCDGITGKVVYEETAFFIEPQNPMESQRLFNECAVYEVIGNIHDNPELLKGE